LTSIYQSPLFKNPLYLDNLLVISIKKKRELLVVELFTNKVEIGDILLNTSIVVTRYIDFFFIMAEDIYKAVIEVGNTVSSIDKVLIAIL